MGGSGSGRWGWHNKKTQVEVCYRWPISGLKKYLKPGTWSGTCWMKGEKETGSLGYRVLGDERPETLRVFYTINKRSGNSDDLDYRINLVTTPLYWGSVRYWFECPLDGCGRRVGCLYLPPGGRYFACRHCYDLSYRSQSEWHRDKAMFERLAGKMQNKYPGLNWKDMRDIFGGKQPGHWIRMASNRNLAELEAYDWYEGYLTADELCRDSGLTPENLKELESVRVLVPDTEDGRYRPKLAGWGKKLAYLLGQGWTLVEIKR